MVKYLGQHFLINKKKLRRIVDALELKPGETIIEIGPGHGEITEELRIKNYELREKLKIIAIEKDEKFVQFLQQKFSGDKNIKIIQGDVLRVLSTTIHNLSFKIQRYKIVGNIPYYITGRLLRVVGELKKKPSLTVLTIQKEVAERICGRHGMNLLAASVQFWAKPEIMGYVPKKYFRPTPKVDSAIIKLKTRTEMDFRLPKTEKYYKLIKLLFKQPRKTILNNLRLTTNDQRLLKEKIGLIKVNPNDRPQDLSIKQIIKLSTLF